VPAASDLVRQLSDKASAKRRSAAKQLRKLKLQGVGPELLQALEREVRDPRTWETQYQMVMALAECGYADAVPFLRDLIGRQVEPMVIIAIGDALIRLDDRAADDPGAIVALLSSGNLRLAEGGLRAVAMLQLKLTPSVVRQVIQFASRPENAQVRFWVAAAAPGWEGPEVETFLRECSASGSAETKKAAEAALQKKYLRWSPL
jgi:HEAT repeat protein